jgi:peptide/nickel transport system ATP-binding protein
LTDEQWALVEPLLPAPRTGGRLEKHPRRSIVDGSCTWCGLATHDLGLAWNIADRLAVMYLGRIVEQGPTEAVLAAPRHPYTRALLSVVPEVRHAEPQILTGEPPDPTRVPGGCRFHPRCPALASGQAARAGVDDRCRNEPVPILRGVAEHHGACFLTDESVKIEGGDRVGR